MEKRRPYPSDVSDEEWSFAAPYLTLMNQDAPQRRYELRELFNALRWLARAGAAWRMLPTNFPPWEAVYQQTQRWLRGGCFEAMVQDLRSVLRVAQGRQGQPSAVILDGRTLQSTCESGPRAGYDGYKRKRGSKVHMAVDTLGHLLAVHITPANEQERAQVQVLAREVQLVTGQTVKLAFADQGYTGEEPAQAARDEGIELQVIKLPEAKKGFVLLPRRWVVERSFGWLNRFRRLARDYEEGAFTGARRRGSLGKILQANGGTLFLDEIGDMPLTLQARLLRVLQERIVTPLGSAKAIPVNVALVCATHRNLRDMIARGTFRDDLYYRLNGLLVKLPPLRQRRDFEAVLNRLLVGEHGGQRFRVAPEVLRLLKTYDWPGNIRQLVNLVRSAMVMAEGDEIQLDDLPDDFLEDVRHREQPAQEPPAHDMLPVSADQATLDLLESSLIRQVLKSNGGNVSAAARALGVSRNRIYRKLQSLGAAPTSDLQSPQRDSRPL